MESYFIKLSTYGTATPQIIDDEVMYQAEHGMNYLNPDEFDYLCEAECMRDAEEFYFENLSEMMFTKMAERNHP